MTRLEPEQEELLAVLCEAARRQPRSERSEFTAFRVSGGHFVRHPQLPDENFGDFHWGDLMILRQRGLLHVLTQSGSRTTFTFDVDPRGFERWEQVQAAKDGPAVRVDDEIRRLVDSEATRQRFSGAFAKWAQAEALLWSADTEPQLTTVGHLCREAMQSYAFGFAKALGVEQGGDPARTVDRIRSGLHALRPHLPAALVALLDALLAYWGTVSDVVQRQEHGALKHGESLGWEDARLVVFHTALVMFELTKAGDRVGWPRASPSPAI